MSIISIYQGKPITLIPTIIESPEEIQFRLQHSLVVSNDPILVGLRETFQVHGMQYTQEEGYSPDLKNTQIMRFIVKNNLFRQPLLNYIAKYTHADDSTILRAIGRELTDATVIDNLSKLSRKSGGDRVQSRVHDITNMLSRVPHISITDYLDYGTGDGSIAAAVGNILNAQAWGVDIYHMDRPIPTLVVKDGQSLPQEWTGRFQLITAFVAFHHVKTQRKLLSELHRVLAPGGLLFIREHDYRSMEDASSLMRRDIDRDHPIVTQKDDLYRQFLDAIHIASMAFSGEDAAPSTSEHGGFWSLYRSRIEWHQMILSTGLSHVCTTYRANKSIESQMISKGPMDEQSSAWIAQNPQRLYESTYMKIGEEQPDNLILEFKTNRASRLKDFFPKKGGSSGVMPDIEIGVNYDEEILSYMTPWHVALETSKAIAVWVKQLKEKNIIKSDRITIYDGTGGAGGNIISLLTNMNIGTIHVYEQVGQFFKYLTNNIVKYTGIEYTVDKYDTYVISNYFLGNIQPIYMYNKPFPLDELLKPDKRSSIIPASGSLLFLDVPWISEGCDYKLNGYTYSGYSLEDVARKWITAGGIGIILKLPPDYKLGIKYEEKILDKETLYAVFPWNIKAKKVYKPTITISLKPKPQVRITSSTPLPVVTSQREMSYEDLVNLIKIKYPSLMKMADDTISIFEDQVDALRQAVQDIQKNE